MRQYSLHLYEENSLFLSKLILSVSSGAIALMFTQIDFISRFTNLIDKIFLYIAFWGFLFCVGIEVVSCIVATISCNSHYDANDDQLDENGRMAAVKNVNRYGKFADLCNIFIRVSFIVALISIGLLFSFGKFCSTEKDNGLTKPIKTERVNGYE